MDLTYITHAVCPDCHGVVTAESRDNRHTNGEWNESRKFECGARVVYSPNFRTESFKVSCPHTQEVMEKTRLRREAKDRLEKYIKKMAVDDAFKDEVWMYVKYIRVD